MKPPNECPHPTFLNKPEAAKYSHLTLCTMYQMITGHTFIGKYTQCFYPKHTPAQITCPCSKPVQTVEHVLLVCPLHNATHQKHLTASGCPWNLMQLFNHPKHVHLLLCFLKETGIYVKPRTEWELGWGKGRKITYSNQTGATLPPYTPHITPYHCP